MVVGLAVAIPVGVFVVAPKLGQSAVDMISLHIHNATFYNLYPVDDTSIGQTPTNGTADFELTIHSPMFMGAIMKETLITMVAASYNNTTMDGGGDQDYYWTNGPMANYTMTEQTIINGDNHIVQKNVSVLFNQSANCYPEYGMGCLRAFYWTVDAVSGTAVQYLNITAEPTLVALGLIKIKTKLHKTMVCNCIPGSNMCNPEKTSIWDPNQGPLPPADAHRLKSSTGDDGALPNMSLFCEPKGTDILNATAWNLTKRPASWQSIQSVKLWTPFGDVALV